MFDYNNITPKAYYEFNSTTNTIFLRNISKAFCEKIIVNESEKFTFSITNNYSERIRYYVFVADKNMNYITNYAWGNGLNASASWQRSFTLPQNSKYLLISILDFPDELNAKDYIQVQVEPGLTKTDYIEGKSQTFTFPLGNEKLMLGDYLADDGIHHVRKQVVLDGSEDWNQNSTYLNVYRLDGFLKDALIVEPRQMLSDYFGYGGLLTTGSGTIQIGKFYQWKSLPQRLVLGYNSTSLSDFKTWLSTHNTTVEYELQEEIIVPYTSAQQEVYNQIKQALSYEEQTNISSNTIALFNVEAYQNTKLILQDISNAIVALGGV